MKKSLTIFAAIAAATLSLAACSGAGAGSENKGSKAELTFWHGYTEADGKVLNKIVDDFNASQNEVSIKVQINPWSVIDDTLLPALSSGKGPDIVAMPAERLPVYADKGAFVELDDFYRDPTSNLDKLAPAAVEMETVNGHKYGVPSGFVPLAMFYNKTLFAQAGITTPPATWDEWIATAKKLTVDADNDGIPEQFGLGLPDHATVANGVWPSLFYGNGGDIVKDGKAVVDSPENARTLKTWVDAVRNDKISPTGLDGIAGDKLFSSGKAAMYLGGPWMSSIAQESKIDFGIAAVPAGPKAQAASAIGISMAVTQQKDDSKAAAARKFFSYFMQKEQATAWSLGSGWPPLRTDIPAGAVASNPVVEALTKQAEFGRPLLPGVVNSTDVLTAVDKLTQRAVAGENIKDLLSETQASVQKVLDTK
ncbi:ABC transporter substrate-binding protein [Arthrobacter sp. ISL-30]|uniref:ABC transporter substrate-binding protein n=1 Tax=Arthrobacter sp. ISL-30 TaxID=2819109 RepID=UPI001BE83547|nr:ABC transporter substrate-binding protein [Arthrobacter sp. ISL-30]MBT2514649.1 ABC transporter substrate-binding protein [Arthrobacter sp. ISL-30]